jgi:Fe-S-cluster containining protein
VVFKSFHCKQCGHCCIDIPGAFSNSVEEDDVRMWKRKHRGDILRWVISKEDRYGIVLYYLWFDPETGEEVKSCPWLEILPDGKYSCLIHDVKPRHCRDWPHTRQDIMTSDCPAIIP